MVISLLCHSLHFYHEAFHDKKELFLSRQGNAFKDIYPIVRREWGSGVLVSDQAGDGDLYVNPGEAPRMSGNKEE